MQHGYMYGGAYEANYPGLRPGTSTYRTTEGDERPLPEWPDDIDGVRVSYMEKAGKKFFAVRLQHDDRDIVLENPVAIDPLRHMGNRRFAAEPVMVSDDEASALLDDVIRQNPEKQRDIALMINRINQIRRAARPKSGS